MLINLTAACCTSEQGSVEQALPAASMLHGFRSGGAASRLPYTTSNSCSIGGSKETTVSYGNDAPLFNTLQHPHLRPKQRFTHYEMPTMGRTQKTTASRNCTERGERFRLAAHAR